MTIQATTTIRSGKVGENALDRAVRLLAKFNERFSDPEVDGMEAISLVINKTGAAGVVNAYGEEIFSGSTSDVVEFLAAPIAQQLRSIKRGA